MIKLASRLLLVAFLSISMMNSASAQSSYSDQKSLSDQLQKLSKTHSNFAKLRSLAKSPDGNDIWLLTIGTGDIATKPAIAVIGGAEGAHILGTELSLQFAKNLLENQEANAEILESTVFYVIASANPDAAQQYFATTKYERGGNGSSYDDDRDGVFDEDSFEDLNGDGFITMMRVEDATGTWMPSTEDERILVEAKTEDGEKGSYLLFTEGRDNDKDGTFNEDGVGGVNINKNFTFDFPYFSPGSGENMASENETRAILDFLFDEGKNVFAVVSFGLENNLSSPLKFNRGAVSKRVIDGWYEDDIAINKLVSDTYNEVTSSKGAPSGAPQQGDLFQWAYFHYGRFSFSTPGWWTPEVEGSKFKNADALYLAWAEAEGLTPFVDWTEIDHPDFPGKKVEVGGIKPFAAIPPTGLIDSLGQTHTEFILKIAEMKPVIELVNVKTESAGKGLTRITADLHNSGIFPTASHVGTRTFWVNDVMVDVELSNKLNLVSGEKRSYHETIKGGETVSYSWLVRGSGSITIKAGAPQSGFSTIKETIK